MPDRPSDIFEMTLAPGVVMGFRQIPGGSFRMGQLRGESNEEPVHLMKIPCHFWLGETPVTQLQYRLMAEQCLDELSAIGGNRGVSPSHFPTAGRGDDYPVEQVSWDDATCICNWLTKSALLPEGCRAALPTEAQWEYACRAGTKRSTIPVTVKQHWVWRAGSPKTPMEQHIRCAESKQTD
ncbi:MAG: formylglycine-generating enzyme family protein [Planctomycetaceae bacterium]|nr:formylglycine-generating enzyme family protein [Planctomycetaceae bacterium]